MDFPRTCSDAREIIAAIEHAKLQDERRERPGVARRQPGRKDDVDDKVEEKGRDKGSVEAFRMNGGGPAARC